MCCPCSIRKGLQNVLGTSQPLQQENGGHWLRVFCTSFFGQLYTHQLSLLSLRSTLPASQAYPQTTAMWLMCVSSESLLSVCVSLSVSLPLCLCLCLLCLFISCVKLEAKVASVETLKNLFQCLPTLCLVSFFSIQLFKNEEHIGWSRSVENWTLTPWDFEANKASLLKWQGCCFQCDSQTVKSFLSGNSMTPKHENFYSYCTKLSSWDISASW